LSWKIDGLEFEIGIGARMGFKLRSLVEYPKHQFPAKSGCSANPEGIEHE